MSPAQETRSWSKPTGSWFDFPGLRLARPVVPGYPSELVEQTYLANGEPLLLRPIKPQDQQLELDFLRQLSAQTRYQRLLSPRRLLPGELKRLTEIDYEQEMALVALLGPRGRRKMIGVARYVIDRSRLECDFAIVIADAHQGMGLGHRLLDKLFDAARDAGVQTATGITLKSNQGMLRLARGLGFEVSAEPGDASLSRLKLDLWTRREGWISL